MWSFLSSRITIIGFRSSGDCLLMWFVLTALVNHESYLSSTFEMASKCSQEHGRLFLFRQVGDGGERIEEARHAMRQRAVPALAQRTRQVEPHGDTEGHKANKKNRGEPEGEANRN